MNSSICAKSPDLWTRLNMSHSPLADESRNSNSFILNDSKTDNDYISKKVVEEVENSVRKRSVQKQLQDTSLHYENNEVITDFSPGQRVSSQEKWDNMMEIKHQADKIKMAAFKKKEKEEAARKTYINMLNKFKITANPNFEKYNKYKTLAFIQILNKFNIDLNLFFPSQSIAFSFVFLIWC